MVFGPIDLLPVCLCARVIQRFKDILKSLHTSLAMIQMCTFTRTLWQNKKCVNLTSMPHKVEMNPRLKVKVPVIVTSQKMQSLPGKFGPSRPKRARWAANKPRPGLTG